jgi:RNA polymerase sigma-70 factor, ECF subfamily
MARRCRELYLLYYHRLTRFVNRMTRRHELIYELINDTFFVVWEKAGKFRGDSRVSTWIMGIAYRRGLNLMRVEYRAQKRMVLPMTEDQVGPCRIIGTRIGRPVP